MWHEGETGHRKVRGGAQGGEEQVKAHNKGPCQVGRAHQLSVFSCNLRKWNLAKLVSSWVPMYELCDWGGMRWGWGYVWRGWYCLNWYFQLFWKSPAQYCWTAAFQVRLAVSMATAGGEGELCHSLDEIGCWKWIWSDRSVPQATQGHWTEAA